MKKLITLLLVLVLSFSMFAGCDNKKDSSSEKTDSSSSTVDIGGDKVKDRNELDFNYSTGVGGNITYDTTPLTSDKAPTEGASYSYNLAISDMPTAWNIHTYQSNTATYVLDYTTDALYSFDYNLEKDGYRIVPSMATDYPEDVTSQFVGKWNIEEGDANRVYKVILKDNLKFDNGDEITAQSFVDSYKLLLNPNAANYRADSFFSGNLVIANSKFYALQGQTVNIDSTEYYDTWEEADKDTIVFDLTNSYVGAFLSENYSSYVTAYGAAWILHTGFSLGYNGKSEIFTQAELEEMLGKTYSEIAADEKMSAIWKIVLGWWQTDPDEELHFFCVRETYETGYNFENVGFFANEEENALYVVNEKELSGFYLLYSLASDFFLVHKETYEKCISESQGVYTNSYGTSVDTYVGFGPYKLTTYTSDNQMSFVKNKYWHGYADEANKNFYWTTDINMYKVPSAETRLQMFLQGKIDSYGLQAADMDDYQSSPYTYFTEGDSTWFIALNPDMEGLKAAQELAQASAGDVEVNKTIITIKEFRQALSFSVDRAAYELALDPLGSVAKSLYGNMIVSDPENGVAYRTTEEAKDAILKFWGLYDLVGTVYETKDEAIASITGYDLAGAKALFNQAYDKAVEQGLISAEAAASGKFEIQIVIGQPGSGSSDYYNNGYELLKKVWTDAVIGTKLEGKLSFTQSAPLGSSGFSDYLKNNTVDVLFGVGWTGSVLDPYSLMEAYVTPNYQYDPGWDTTSTNVDVTLTDVDGKTYTLRASVYDWGYTALGGAEIKAYVVEDGKLNGDYVYVSAGVSASSSIRLAVLAAVETAVLEQYDMIPVGSEASASMKGMKIKFGTEEYVFGIGRGGVKYMTYNYTDAEWNAFVTEQGGTLNYK